MVFGLSGTGVRLGAERVFAFGGMRSGSPFQSAHRALDLPKGLINLLVQPSLGASLGVAPHLVWVARLHGNDKGLHAHPDDAVADLPLGLSFRSVNRAIDEVRLATSRGSAHRVLLCEVSVVAHETSLLHCQHAVATGLANLPSVR